MLKQRSNLKLVSMSDSPLEKRFQAFFLDAPLVERPGRLHPVEIFYTRVCVPLRP